MNMKSLIALTALTAAGAASAAVTSGNTLCRIEVDSGAASTIVAVPLVKIGDGSAIPANELVLTDNLSQGDKLLHWNTNSKKWEAWAVNASGAWEGLTISDQNSTLVTPEASVTLTRGDAVWVERAVTNEPFYVYGQVAGSSATAATSTAEQATSATSPAYTMMSAPTTDPAGFQLNTLVSKKTAGSFADGDKIVVVDPNARLNRREYTYKNSTGNFSVESDVLDQTYGYPIGVTWTAVGDDVLIPVGCGFWYVSVGGNPTISW